MSGLSLDNTAMAPLINGNDEPGGDSPWLPTTLNPQDYIDQTSEHGDVSSDAHMSSGVDEYGIHAFGCVQSHVLEPPTPVDPGYSRRTNMDRNQWTPSELPPLPHSMPKRQSSIQADTNDTIQTVTDEFLPTAIDEAFSTTSSVTLQGDDISHFQSGEEDDKDYNNTNDRHKTLCEQEQEILDDFSNLGETLQQLEISIDAFYLGGHDAASLSTLVHNTCCMNTELQNSASSLHSRLCALNEEAAHLGVTVKAANRKAKNLKTGIEDMDLDTLLADLEPYRIFYSQNSQSDAMYTPIQVPLLQESLHQYSHIRSAYEVPMIEHPSYSHGREYLRASFYANDTSHSPAADMHVMPPRHAGWYGPSADHASDHWMVSRPNSTTFPVQDAYYISPQPPTPSNYQPYNSPFNPGG